MQIPWRQPLLLAVGRYHCFQKESNMGIAIAPYLKVCLQPNRSTQTLRSSAEGLLAVPSLREAKLQGTRQRAFSVVAPALWNALPPDVKENNYQTFR